jgi:hypothetical protein
MGMSPEDAYALLHAAEIEVEQLKKTITGVTKQRNELAFNAGKQTGMLQRELEKTRQDAALVVHALNCAIQLIEALITYTPEGTSLHPGVATCKATLDQAIAAFRGGNK